MRKEIGREPEAEFVCICLFVELTARFHSLSLLCDFKVLHIFIMPGTKDEVAVEAPETTTEPIVAKTVEDVKAKSEEKPEEEKPAEEKSEETKDDEESKDETTNDASSEAAESNTESESAAEKRPAEDKDEDTEDGTPKKKAKTDSNETESSNGTDEKGAPESA